MYSIKNRVRYSEINSESKLTLLSLMDYLQDCCTFQSEDLGIGVEYLANNHVAWVLSSWQIQITRYPKMGEEICVSTWPYDFKGFYGFRNFIVTDSKGQTLASANSVWVFMDTKRMRPAKITEQIQGIYRNELGEPLSGTWSERKIAPPASGRKMSPVQVAKFHIDTNHHMNNGKYVLVAEEYLPEGVEILGLRAEYKRSAVLGDMLYPVVAAENGGMTVVLADKEENPYAIIQFLSESSLERRNQ